MLELLEMDSPGPYVQKLILMDGKLKEVSILGSLDAKVQKNQIYMREAAIFFALHLYP